MPETDDAITGDIIAAFSASPRIHATEIRVHTTDGRVRLQGIVQTLEEKLAAEATAGQISGVRGIENDLTTSADKSISNLSIERMAQKALDDAQMSFVGVRVEAGVAYVMGRVQSTALEQKAMDIVRAVEGPRDVLSELEIAAGAPVDNIGLANDVMDALSDDPTIVFYNVDVQADEGHIILTGEVENESQLTLARQIAESVAGVKSVENRMSLVETPVR